MSFPGNPHSATPKGIGEVAKEYVRSGQTRGRVIIDVRP